MERMRRRLLAVSALILCAVGVVLWQLCRLVSDHAAVTATVKQGRYTLRIPLSTGTIYDQSFARLTNSKEAWLAVVNPTADAVAALYGKLIDRDAFLNQLQEGAPFFCAVTDPNISHPNLWLQTGAVNPAGILPAQHIIGYRQNGVGQAGLEAAYHDWLRACDASISVTFAVNAVGTVLAGLEQNWVTDGAPNGGVVTTLECATQQIAENALANVNGDGAGVIVMDVQTGNLCAIASTPVYDPTRLQAYLNADNAPFLNRTLCAYSVGSIFKLVIAATALEQGMSLDYMYECTGKTSVYGQTFRCHARHGHGLLNMRDALTVSCNPYFISLGQLLSPEALYATADALGFGKPISLARGITASGGVLPDVSALQIEAEKANFSFGQGQLLASPMQIAALTACIANHGIAFTPRLILGLTEDGTTLSHETAPQSKRVLQASTADALAEMMTAVLADGTDAQGRPSVGSAAGKTSTAQTGKLLATGEEACHAWMTGFFPATNPQYAVTVFVENGGSGNQSAAPVFREIVEQLTLQKSGSQ